MTYTLTTLDNGLKVSNFSSPHTFRFKSGETLERCPRERSDGLMLRAVEQETVNPGGWTDINLEFELNDTVRKALDEIQADADAGLIDVILVPLPVMSSVKAAGLLDMYPNIRTVRMACRETKVIHPNRFCR
jgi:hypothetical protein